ncbi:MAG TPA: response regulator transcription factor [Acidiferrobacterales bacterium]
MKILLIEAYPLLREGIAAVLGELDESVQIHAADDGDQAVKLYAARRGWDLMVLDGDRDGGNGPVALARMREQFPGTPLVVLSSVADRGTVLRAIDQGARGYILKSSRREIVIAALRLVMFGGTYLPASVAGTEKLIPEDKAVTGHDRTLTARQMDVLELLVQGKPNKEIAGALGVSENTIRAHVGAILKFLDARNRAEAGYAAVRQGLVSNRV